MSFCSYSYVQFSRKALNTDNALYTDNKHNKLSHLSLSSGLVLIAAPTKSCLLESLEALG